MSDTVTDSSVAGATIVLQGATGAVGQRLAIRLATAGAKLALPVRRGWQVEKLHETLPTPSSTAPRLIAEVDDGSAAAGFAKGVADSLGPPSAVISCAGAFDVAEVGRERDDFATRLFESNVFAPHRLVRAFAPATRRGAAIRFVFVGAQTLDTRPAAGVALYRAAKAALREFATCFASEIASSHGSSVHIVHPGTIDTPANREVLPDDDRTQWVSIDAVCDCLVSAAMGHQEELEHVVGAGADASGG